MDTEVTPRAGDGTRTAAHAGAPATKHTPWSVLLIATMAGIFAIGLVLDSVTSGQGTRIVAKPVAHAVPQPGADDSFERADSPRDLGTAPSGQHWQATRGIWAVRDHAAMVVTPGRGASLATIESAVPDGHVEVTISTMAPGAGLAFRCRGPVNCWRVEAVPALGTWNVVKVVAGKEKLVGNLGVVPIASGTRIAVDLLGPRITISVNGKRARAFKDDDLANETRAGISLREPASAASARWTHFTVQPRAGRGIVRRSAARVHDTFARPDAPGLGHTPDGAAWHAVRGTFTVRGGRAALSSAPASGPALALVDTGTGDGVVQTTVWRPQQEAGIAFRCHDPENCWRVEIEIGFGSWNVTKIDHGRVTRFGGVGLVTTAPATTVSVRLSGSTITIYINGVRSRTIHDDFLEHETHAGLVVEHHDFSAQTEWSEFVATGGTAR